MIVPGGVLGCDRQNFEGNPTLKEGERYLYFIATVSLPDGNTALSAIEAWPIDESDKVVTPLEGEVSIQRLVDVLEGRAGSEPTESPYDPGDDFPGGG